MTGLDVLYALVTDTGRRWGEIAADFQREDARAIFAPERPNLHFLTRPRGASKTSDLAGIALSWLATEAPPRARGYVIASNADQAGLLLDAAGGFVARTPELQAVLTVENERIIAPNGAAVRVLPASDSGSWGLLNARILVLDEFAQWPETRGARRVWTAVRSTTQKVAGCRLVILSSAGEPSHWSYGVLQSALADPKMWRVHEVPGPVPWQDRDELAALQRELSASEFDRLILNRWSESEDRAVAPEDYAACARPATRHGAAPVGLRGGGWRLHGPRKATRYLITVDIGLQHDSTVLCVAHKEQDGPDGPMGVSVDHLERWSGSRRHHVQLRDVESRLVELSVEYNRAPIHADPDQFVGSLQSLSALGLTAKAFPFTPSSTVAIAVALVNAFRSGAIEVPDTPELRAELLAVRLRSSGPSNARLDHDHGQHDDQAVCIGLACHLLVAKLGSTAVFRQYMARAMERRPTTHANREDREATRALQRVIRSSMPRFSEEPRACRHGVVGRCPKCALLSAS